MSSSQLRSSVTINIRAKSHQRDLIDVAAAKQGRSRSDFMLDVACREAEDFLLDQAFFNVNSKTFDELLSMLEKPLPPTDKLRRLLKTKAPWDES